MISSGKSYPIIYEMRMSASELDMIIKGLKLIKYPNDEEAKLLSQYEDLSKIRNNRALRQYGYMDEMRLNWK